MTVYTYVEPVQAICTGEGSDLCESWTCTNCRHQGDGRPESCPVCGDDDVQAGSCPSIDDDIPDHLDPASPEYRLP